MEAFTFKFNFNLTTGFQTQAMLKSELLDRGYTLLRWEKKGR
jgi:hypothetical protein